MAPGPARIIPSHARANPSRARPLGAFCTNDFRPRTREPRPAAAHRISARTNSILARPNPSAGPNRPKCTNELPATRPNPSHPSRTCRTVRTSSGNARPNPSRPLPVPLSATPDHSAEPAPHRRTSVLPARTPEPERPSARHFPPCRHPSDRLPPQPHPRHPTARPPSLRSGFRPGAAPVPPSASLPEDRYHPVNAPLDRAPLSCDIQRLFILYDVVPAMPPLAPPIAS